MMVWSSYLVWDWSVMLMVWSCYLLVGLVCYVDGMVMLPVM